MATGRSSRRRGGRARSRRRQSPYAELPARTRRTVTYLSALVGALCLIGAVLVLSRTTYLSGFSPDNEVFRTGTVTVGSCISWPRQWGMYRCRATLDSWNPGVRAGVELPDTHEVTVVSRSALSGKVSVSSHLASSGGDAHDEVIMPSDQQPAAYVIKVLIVLGCLAVAFVATAVAARIAWPIALRRHRRKQPGAGLTRPS